MEDAVAVSSSRSQAVTVAPQPAMVFIIQGMSEWLSDLTEETALFAFFLLTKSFFSSFFRLSPSFFSSFFRLSPSFFSSFFRLSPSFFIIIRPTLSFLISFCSLLSSFQISSSFHLLPLPMFCVRILFFILDLFMPFFPPLILMSLWKYTWVSSFFPSLPVSILFTRSLLPLSFFP